MTIHDPAWTAEARELLTPAAVDLLAGLHRLLEAERRQLLALRRERQQAWDDGLLPDYPAEEEAAARGSWRVAPVPRDLHRRRVEITGPVNDAKMVINMLSRNARGDRADTAMLDFEDSMKPSWANLLAGHRNLRGAARGDLVFYQPAAPGRPEKTYRLEPEDMPGIMVRVRGLHLDESNLRVDGSPVSGGLMDLALSLLGIAEELLARGRTPKLYVPKCESHLEARWWNRLFVAAQEACGLERGTLRATFLIETLPAAFEIEAILHEIREHAAGLNVGRWDKIFSDIKVLRAHRDRVLADRASIGLNRPWMRDYALRLVDVCHARGAHAIGGMAAFTPGREPEMRRRQTEKVVEDKRLEAEMGHDGCWVSHPYFLAPALAAFPREHQLEVRPRGLGPRPDLLPVSTPPRTLEGLCTNVRVGIAYLEGWRRDVGCVAWDGLMEDLATLEISRAQTWQWLHHRVTLDDGTPVTRELVEETFQRQGARIQDEVETALEGQDEHRIEETLERFATAREAARELFVRRRMTPFLTPASELAPGPELKEDSDDG